MSNSCIPSSRLKPLCAFWGLQARATGWLTFPSLGIFHLGIGATLPAYDRWVLHSWAQGLPQSNSLWLSENGKRILLLQLSWAPLCPRYRLWRESHCPNWWPSCLSSAFSIPSLHRCPGFPRLQCLPRNRKSVGPLPTALVATGCPAIVSWCLLCPGSVYYEVNPDLGLIHCVVSPICHQAAMECIVFLACCLKPEWCSEKLVKYTCLEETEFRRWWLIKGDKGEERKLISTWVEQEMKKPHFEPWVFVCSKFLMLFL